MQTDITVLNHIETETIYISKRVTVKGNIYRISQAIGRYNYIEICKMTNNPFGGRIGKDFKSWDEATRHYKSPEMKTALLMAEIDFQHIK